MVIVSGFSADFYLMRAFELRHESTLFKTDMNSKTKEIGIL